MRIGITDHAQSTLGDIVFIQLPTPGTEVRAGQEVAMIESVKAASGIHTPFSGIISSVNQMVESSPEMINDAPYASWLFCLTPDAQADATSLLEADQYLAQLD